MTKMSAIRSRAIAILAAGLIFAGCGSGSDPGSGIPPQDPETVARGGVLYEAQCASCHGSDLRGTDLGPSHLSIVYEPNHHADIAFFLAVSRGSRAHHWSFGNMEPVPGLTDEDVAAIVAFVREQQRIHGFEPYPP